MSMTYKENHLKIKTNKKYNKQSLNILIEYAIKYYQIINRKQCWHIQFINTLVELWKWQ